MNVLSVFDGMSGGRLALQKAGIKVDTYFASEVDPYAIKVTQHRFPNTIQLGDVTKVSASGLPKIDLLIGGSPCQGFSFAGGQLAFDDPRSVLFFEYVRLLHEVKPKYFLLENVKMKKEFQDVISGYLGVEPIVINSSLLSAQNRVRLYWTNIPNVTQPEDLGIILEDIIEDGYTDREKSYCVTTRVAGATTKRYLEKAMHQMIMVERPCITKEFKESALCHHIANATDISGNESIKRVYASTGKAPTLTTMQGGHREPKILCGASRGRYLVDGVRQDGKMSVAGLTEQRLEVRPDGKTNCLTTVQKDNHVFYPEEATYRKLTVLECERLQTAPDNYTLIIDENGKQLVSNSQRYKMLGNGWTIDVIAHIFKGLKESHGKDN